MNNQWQVSQVELALWAIAVAVSMRWSFYWTVATNSVLATRLYSLYILQRFTTRSGRLATWLILILLITWCCLLSPAHIYLPTLVDLWTKTPANKDMQLHEVLHDCGNSSTVDVFAIHGLGSDPDSAWSYRNNGTDIRWLRDILPYKAELEQSRIVMINHQTRWHSTAVAADFHLHAEMVLNEIEALREAFPDRPIIFIAHSFGGLLLKKSLTISARRSSIVAKMTRGILFLGVPHKGTRAAFLGALLSCTAHWRGSSTSLLEYLGVDSPQTDALESEFYDTFVRPQSENHSPRPYICNYWEMLSESMGGLVLGPTVSTGSGSPRHGDSIGLYTDHRGLNKFRSSQDPNFVLFWRGFLRALQKVKITSPELVASSASSKHPLAIEISQNPEGEPFQIPFRPSILRNGKFTGRRDLLNSMYHIFHNSPDVLQVVALHGPGGIGKTQIAVEYAYAFQSNYTSIFWIDGSSKAAIHRSFQEIARQILAYETDLALKSSFPRPVSHRTPDELSHESARLSSMNSNTHSGIDVTRNWFERTGNTAWLLIFDNVDDLETFDVSEIFPRTSGGSIILTSRRRDVASRWTGIEVEELEVDEAISMLSKSINLHRDMDETELKIARELVQLLGKFPLAIEQAGAYLSIQQHQTPQFSYRFSFTLQQYIELYQENARKLLDKRPPLSVWNYKNDTVFTTWEVSFRAIRNASSKASDLLLLCGFLASTDIFEEMLHELLFSNHGKLPIMFQPTKTSNNDRADLHQLINLLSSYSFVTFKGSLDSFSIHPLIHFWAKERLPRNKQQNMSTKILRSMSRSLRAKKAEGPEVVYLPYEERIRPHLQVMIYNVKGYASQKCSLKPLSLDVPRRQASTSAVASLLEVTQIWYIMFWYVIQQTVELITTRMGYDIEEGYEPSYLVYKLTAIVRYQDYSFAEKTYRWCLCASGSWLNVWHYRSLEIAGDLAWTLNMQGNRDTAERWYLWLYYARERAYGHEHPATMGALKGIASIHQKRKDFDGALDLYMKAWRGRQKTLGDDDVLTINVVDNIAWLFREQRRYDDAIIYYKLVFASKERLNPMSHASIGDTALDVATMFRMKGDHRSALEWYKLGLSRKEKGLGSSHSRVLQDMRDIGIFLQELQIHDEALEWFERALRAGRKLEGDRVRDTTEWCLETGLSFHLDGRHGKALEWYNWVLTHQETFFGSDHTDIIEFVLQVAVSLQHQMQDDEASRWYSRALAMAQQPPKAENQRPGTISQNITDKFLGFSFKNDETALILAASNGLHEVVQLLLNRGAIPHASGQIGVPALDAACLHGHDLVVRYLLAAEHNATVQHYYTSQPLILASEKGHLNIVCQLLQAGFNASLQNPFGRTALHLAAESGHLDIVHRLLEAGADAGVPNDDGWTALHAASAMGHLDVVYRLLQAGVNVSPQDNDGCTALHLAVQNGYIDVVRQLLLAGADASTQLNDGWTALHLAGQNGHTDVVRLLLEAGANASAPTNKGSTALHLAVQNGHVDVVRQLLLAGADASAQNDDGETALHTAAAGGHLEVVHHLLDARANVDIQTHLNVTALHMATYECSKPIVSMLLEAGAALNHVDLLGQTPLSFAVLNCDAGVVLPLLDSGADVAFVDMYGRTVIDWASLRADINQTSQLTALSQLRTPPERQSVRLHTFIGNLLENTISWPQLYKCIGVQTLGRQLLLYSDTCQAMNAFRYARMDPECVEQYSVKCTICGKLPPDGEKLLMCQSWPDIQLCEGCAETLHGSIGPCYAHDFFDVLGVDMVNDSGQTGLISVPEADWLLELSQKYSVVLG